MAVESAFSSEVTMRRFALLLALTASLALAACAHRGPTSSAASKAPAAPPADTVSGFLTQAAQGGMLEVNAGRLAMQRASNPQVRNFAQQMVNEHTLVNQEVLRLAGTRNVTIPTAPNAEQAALIEKLSSLSGAEFDREYTRAVAVDAHEKSAKLFREGSRVVDGEVRGFAQRTLPRIEMHLDAGRQLRQSVASN